MGGTPPVKVDVNVCDPPRSIFAEVGLIVTDNGE
jgi:hypothetical protein